MTPARAIAVRPGFAVTYARLWMASTARHEMAVCVVIAFWIGFILAVIACAGSQS